MKGIVFSEFIEMVESVFSPEMADTILDVADPPSGGAYTAVGTYDHKELIALVQALAEQTGKPAHQLVHQFGEHLAGRFVTLYPGFFEGVEDTFAFLETIEGHVHKEVKKLYPDAELPRFETRREGETLRMTYRSTRPFADLAEGLIEGCAHHFGDRLQISRSDRKEGDLNIAEFELRKVTE